MFLSNESVFCIRNRNNDNWGDFDQQMSILPKREEFMMIEEQNVDKHTILTTMRKPEFHKKVAQWSTHMALLVLFVKKRPESKWLLVIEDSVQIGDLEQNAKPGLTLLRPDASAYILDKNTAAIILENAKLFYADYGTILTDIAKLKLITINETPYLKSLKKPSPLLKYIPLYLSFLLVLLLFLLLCPLNSSRGAEEIVYFTKMFTTKEAGVCTKR